MAAAAIWVIGLGIFFWTLPVSELATITDDRLLMVLIAVALVVPAGMILLGVMLARSLRAIRSESYRVQTAIDALRQIQLAQKAMQSSVVMEPLVDKPTPPPAPQTDTSPDEQSSRFTSRREVSRLIVPRAAPQAPVDQPSLALDAGLEDTTTVLERLDYIKALNFPDDEHDKAGFDALRRALRDRTARRLVQASQDVLTLLSQDGIYMDDLHPDPVPAKVWRQFAAGARGKPVDALGAVRERSALGLIAGRMREDTIFRDAVHHFLRRFDEMLVTFEDQATDTDLLALAETRTARAFMLLARATGTFD